MNIPKWLTSSADEQELALTVKGILTAIVPFLLLVSNVKGWHLTQSGLDGIIDALLNVLSIFVGLIGAIMTFLGLLRKMAMAKDGPPDDVVPPAPPAPTDVPPTP